MDTLKNEAEHRSYSLAAKKAPLRNLASVVMAVTCIAKFVTAITASC